MCTDRRCRGGVGLSSAGPLNKVAYVDPNGVMYFPISVKNIQCRALTSQSETNMYVYICQLKCSQRLFGFSHFS